MKMKTMLMTALAVVVVGGSAAAAQPYSNDNRRYDNNDQYGQRDPRGDDRNDNFRSNDRRDGAVYYRQGAYEQNCRRGNNQVAGTIFGAIAGGMIGSAASHGNGGAVVGGAVLGGLLGNTISRDIDCNDQPYAFQTYSTGLNGRIGRRYEWNHGQSRGYFIPTREFRRNGAICRSFTETTFRNGRELTRNGISCRAQDGNWRFD